VVAGCAAHGASAFLSQRNALVHCSMQGGRQKGHGPNAVGRGGAVGRTNTHAAGTTAGAEQYATALSSSVLRFVGVVGGHKCTVLIDGGSGGNFVQRGEWGIDSGAGGRATVTPRWARHAVRYKPLQRDRDVRGTPALPPFLSAYNSTPSARVLFHGHANQENYRLSILCEPTLYAKACRLSITRIVTNQLLEQHADTLKCRVPKRLRNVSTFPARNRSS
jgi:hypothetical protein